jgi:GrpB-like predicted nucleotidyltransferase (UPF0157 family)
MVTIVEHDPSWPESFALKAQLIRSRLQHRALRIDHVGSTSVPGLAAKPVIDLQVSLASLEPRARLVEDFVALGYVHVDLGAFDRVYPFFTKPAVWPATHHVHLCVAGSAEERNHLAFRDHLRLNPTVAAEYAHLKAELARLHEGITLASQEQYSLAKSHFVSTVWPRRSAWVSRSSGKVTANPSLERGPSTGKPPWPRGSCCLSSASRPRRLTGGGPLSSNVRRHSPLPVLTPPHRTLR